MVFSILQLSRRLAVDEGNMSYSRTLLLAIGLVIFACPDIEAIAQTPQIQLRISANKCVQGAVIAPPPIWVSIFDSSKVPGLIQAIREFRFNSSPVDSAGAEKMLDMYNALEQLVKKTPALYRSTKAASGPLIIKVAPAKRYVIFGFGDDESALTSVAEEEFEPKAGQSNNVVLNLSAAEECAKR